VLGVLTVVPRGASSFSVEERDLLSVLAGHVAIALENARLYQETAAAAQAAASGQGEAAAFEARVGRIVADMGRAPNLQRAAERLAAGASDALGVGAIWAAVKDGSGALCLCREGGGDPRPVPPVEENGLPSLVARAVAERTIQAWSGATPCWEAREGLVARRGSAAVPILSDGGQGPAAGPGAVLGAFLLPDPEGSGWPAELLARVEQLGREAAPLLARARELEAMQSSREQLAQAEAEARYFSVLKELTRIAGTSPALTSLVDAVGSRLRLLPGCDGVTVAFEDPYDGKVWYAREPWAMGEAAVPFWVPGVESSAQLALGLQEPVVIPDLEDSLLPLHRRWAEAGLRSLVEVPLVTGGRSGGLLVVASRVRGAFPPEQVAFFTSVAAAVGEALAKARRLAEAEGTP
jgi:GAF domain-containing protein